MGRHTVQQCHHQCRVRCACSWMNGARITGEPITISSGKCFGVRWQRASPHELSTIPDSHCLVNTTSDHDGCYPIDIKCGYEMRMGLEGFLTAPILQVPDTYGFIIGSRQQKSPLGMENQLTDPVIVSYQFEQTHSRVYIPHTDGTISGTRGKEDRRCAGRQWYSVSGGRRPIVNHRRVCIVNILGRCGGCIGVCDSLHAVRMRYPSDALNHMLVAT